MKLFESDYIGVTIKLNKRKVGQELIVNVDFELVINLREYLVE